MARPGVNATGVEPLGELVAATGLTLDAEAMGALDEASAPPVG